MSGEQQRKEPETGQPEAINVPKQTEGEADSAGRSGEL